MIAALATSQLVAVIFWARESDTGTRASLPTAILALFVAVTLSVLSYAEHFYSTRPSTIVNIYLLFTALFDATRARTLWLQRYNSSAAIILTTATAIKLFLLLLEASEKRGFLAPRYKVLSSEDTSGVINRFFFWWQIPLFRSGYNKSLLPNDLFVLDKHLNSRYLLSLLQTLWNDGKLLDAFTFISPWLILNALQCLNRVPIHFSGLFSKL